jgi:hypothetical protein
VDVVFDAGDTDEADFVDGLPPQIKQVEIGAGRSSQTIEIDVAGDRVVEADETFGLTPTFLVL